MKKILTILFSGILLIPVLVLCFVSRIIRPTEQDYLPNADRVLIVGGLEYS